MKTLLLVTGAAMGALALAGCATHETTTTTTSTPAHQTYSGSELKQTGQPDTAGAIGASDPSAQIAR